LGIGNALNASRYIPTPPLNVYSGIKDVCSGFQYNMILTETGKVYSYGNNNVTLHSIEFI
jgi:alpha-tubulin suppressor-like RCC1 family protein